MSVQVYKNGIVSAGGSGVGENLVLDSASKNVSHLTSGNEYIAINLGQSYMDIASGSTVTISFDIELKYMNSSDSYKSYFLVYNTNNKGPKQISNVSFASQIYDGETVGTTIKKRVSGTTTIVDRASSNTNNNWIEFYTGYGTENVYAISNLKIELGSHHTPWTPAPSDAIYVGAEHGFIETDGSIARFYSDFAEVNEFIEY